MPNLILRLDYVPKERAAYLVIIRQHDNKPDILRKQYRDISDTREIMKDFVEHFEALYDDYEKLRCESNG